MATSTSFPRIAILGAGPVGLTLASLFAKSGVPYTTFELRPSPISNPDSDVSPLVPSGSLDLHVESGLLALKACGLYEQFCEIQSDCSEECIVSDKDGVRRYYDDGEGGQRPEIARNALMNLLLGSLGEDQGGMVRWGCKVLDVQPAAGEGKEYLIRFADAAGVEQEEAFDLVLGADGAWSRLRPLITDVKPYYSTVNCITLTIPSISTTYPDLSTFIGKGSYTASSAHRSLMAQRGSFDSARLYLMLRDPSGRESYLQDQGLLDLSNAALSAKLRGEGGLFEGWGDQLQQLIVAGCEASEQVSLKPLHMLPIGHSWAHRAGVTLLGDAAHLMTPFAGEGVNCGMLDAAELAELLVPALLSLSSSAGGDAQTEAARRKVDEALEGYERKMFERMQPVAQGTWDNLLMIFDEEAPAPFVRFFESFGPPPAEGEGEGEGEKGEGA